MKDASIREQVLAALVAGEEVFISEFAKRAGSHSMVVLRVLQGLSDHLTREERSKGPGKRSVAYAAGDKQELELLLEREIHARTGGAPRLRFDELLAAWGISLTLIDLPVRQFSRFGEVVA